MRRLLLLFVPVLFLAAACAQPHYLWHHEAGLGDIDLQQAQKVCGRYAAEQAPLSYSRGFTYPYAGYLSFYGGSRHSHRHHNHRHHLDAFSYRGYYPYGYFSDPNSYAYQQELSRACLKGKGWERIRIDAG